MEGRSCRVVETVEDVEDVREADGEEDDGEGDGLPDIDKEGLAEDVHCARRESERDRALTIKGPVQRCSRTAAKMASPEEGRGRREEAGAVWAGDDRGPWTAGRLKA